MCRPSLVLALTLATSSCGSIKEKAEQAAAEAIAENAVEAASGGKVQMDADGAKVTLQANDGTTAVQLGQGNQLPANWPADVPIYPGATLSMAAASAEGGQGGQQAVFTTPDPADKVMAFYKEHMPAGLSQKAELNMAGAKSLVLANEGDQRTLTLSVTASESETTVMIQNATQGPAPQ